jgi:hypothetical protein
MQNKKIDSYTGLTASLIGAFAGGEDVNRSSRERNRQGLRR